MKKILFIFLLTVTLGGCGYYNTFYNARKYYKAADYDKTLEKCDKIIASEKYSSLHDDAWFLKGKALAQMGRTEEAKAPFKKILADFSDSRFVSESRMSLFFIYLADGDYSTAYRFISGINAEFDDSDSAVNFAKVLFLMGRKTELQAFSQRLGQKDDAGRETAVYDRILREEYDGIIPLVRDISDAGKRDAVARNAYIMTLDNGLTPFMDPASIKKYSFVAELTKEGLTADRILSLMAGFDALDPVYGLVICGRLMDYYLEREETEFAKIIALKIKDTGARKIDQNREYVLRNTFSQVKYSNLPQDWSLFLTDNTKFYLFDKIQNMYQLRDERWEDVNAETPPINVESYEHHIWDSLNRRWIFFDHDQREWAYLDGKDFSWGRIKVDGDDLPVMNAKRLYYSNREIYYFGALDTVYRVTLNGRDKASVTQIDIHGILPALTGYTLIDFVKYGYFVVIGGKEGEAVNYSVFYLNIKDKIPEWEEGYLNAPVLLSGYVIVPYNTTSNVVLFLWDEKDYEEVRGALVARFDPQDVRLDLNEVTRDFETIPDFFEYEQDSLSGSTNSIHYVNMNDAFNRLMIYRLTLAVTSRSSTDAVRDTDTGANALKTDILFRDGRTRGDIDNLVESVTRLDQEMKRPVRNNRLIGDILYADLGHPALASVYYESYLGDFPDDAHVLYAMAYIKYRYLNDSDGAREYLRRFDESHDGSGLLGESAEQLRVILSR